MSGDAGQGAGGCVGLCAFAVISGNMYIDAAFFVFLAVRGNA